MDPPEETGVNAGEIKVHVAFARYYRRQQSSRNLQRRGLYPVSHREGASTRGGLSGKVAAASSGEVCTVPRRKGASTIRRAFG
jgi:hypothetical protein